MDYTRYLRSKITVDDRALNITVLQTLEQYVQQTMETSPQCLRIVEVGAGVGAMFSRLYKRNSIFNLCNSLEYTMVDIKEDVLNAAGEELMRLFESENNLPENKSQVNVTSSNTIREPNVHHRNSVHTCGIVSDTHSTVTSMAFPGRIKVNIVLCDALRYLTQTPAHFDIVVAAAVLDLWDVDEVLPIMKGCLNPASPIRAFYFPITFDGVTDFFPSSTKGAAFDTEVENNFHKSMGYRTTLGERTMSCHTGRRLVPSLQQYGASLRSVGSSAWAVYPNPEGSYHADEKYFLSCIISFIGATVINTENTSSTLGDGDAFQSYLDSRRKQLEDGTLYYLAHNIDVFCVV